MKLSRSALTYIKGGIALIKNVVTSNFVGQAEADRRTAICLSCPNNIFPDKGPFIAWSDKMAIISVGNRRSIGYDDLGQCGTGKDSFGCGCPLRSKVWIQPPFKLPANQEAQMAQTSPNCWQLTTTEFRDMIP